MIYYLLSSINNLYFASAWSFPGGGYEGAATSGYNTAQKILNNVKERNDRAKNDENFKNDDRDVDMVLDQYSEKYEVTQSKPDTDKGDPTTLLTKVGVTELLQKNGMSDEYISEFLNIIKLTEDGDHYIKVRDSYLTSETQLVNIYSDRTIYLKDINNTLK
mgnify:CR=1 FL=1